MKSAVWIALLFVLGCGGSALSTTVVEPNATLEIHSSNTGAEVWLNGRFTAPIALPTTRLRVVPGRYRLEVRRDGYHSFYKTVDLSAQAKAVVQVELAQFLR